MVYHVSNVPFSVQNMQFFNNKTTDYSLCHTINFYHIFCRSFRKVTIYIHTAYHIERGMLTNKLRNSKTKDNIEHIHAYLVTVESGRRLPFFPRRPMLSFRP